MRVLMINKFLYRRGGAETYVFDLTEELEKNGIELSYFGMYDENNTFGNRLGLYTRNVDFHQKSLERFTYPAHIIYSKEAYDKARKVIRDFKPDVAHLNNINFQITPSVIDALHDEGVPIVMTAHDFQLVCPNHLLFVPQTGEICEECLTHVPTACIRKKCIHGSLAKSVVGAAEAALYRNRKTYDYIDRIIAPSLMMKEVLERNARFKGKVEFLRNFSKNYEEKEVEKKDYVLYFGRFYEEKGIRNLVKAAQKLPEIQFVAAGSGPLEDILKYAPNITNVGFLTGDALETLVREAKFTVYPSIWYENCPLSIIESQKLGTPCLATGIGGMKELAGEEFLIHGTDARSLKAAIRELYYNENKLKRMYEDMEEHKKTYPDLEKYTKKAIGIYEDVVAGKKGV